MMKLFALASLIALAGCAPADQRAALRAIGNEALSKCPRLADVHWRAATRRGRISLSPLGGGSHFSAFDRTARTALEFLDLIFAARFVGAARTFIQLPSAVMARAYQRAGSPNDAAAARLGLDPRPFTRDEQIDAFSIDGVASGWLSDETDIYCGTDISNGRYFFIKELRPAFPVSGPTPAT